MTAAEARVAGILEREYVALRDGDRDLIRFAREHRTNARTLRRALTKMIGERRARRVKDSAGTDWYAILKNF